MPDDEDDKTQVLGYEPQASRSLGPPAILRCVDTTVLRDQRGKEIVLDGDAVTVGRDEDNDVSLNASGISRRHARLSLDSGVWHVEDLGSANGTRVNNSMVRDRALEHGDTVAFGRACYKFTLLDTLDNPSNVRNIDLGAGDETLFVQPTTIGTGAAAHAAAADDRPDSPPLPRAPRAAAPRGAARREPEVEGSLSWTTVAVLVIALLAAGFLILGPS